MKHLLQRTLLFMTVVFFLSSMTLYGQEGVYEGETLFGQGTRFSERIEYAERDDLLSGSDDVSNPAGREFQETKTVTGLHYGVRPDLTATLLVPYIDRTSVREQSGSAVTFEDSGPGDLSLLGKYRIYKHDWKKGSFNLSLIGGLELPTGETDATDGGQEIPEELQLGSGSWDPIIAAGASLEDEPFKLDGTLILKENTTGDDAYKRGNIVDAEIKAGYRFYLANQYPGPAGKVRLGLRWRHEESDEQDGTTVSDTGSDRFFLRPEAIYHPTVSTDISLSLQIPLYEAVDGQQVGGGQIISLRVGYRF